MNIKFYILLCFFGTLIGLMPTEDQRWPMKRKLQLLEKLADDEHDGVQVLTELLYGSVKWYCKYGNKHREDMVQKMEVIIGKDLVSELRAMPREWEPRFNTTRAWDTKRKMGLINKFLNDDTDGIDTMAKLVFRAIKFHVRNGHKFDKGSMLDRITRIVGQDDIIDIRQGNLPMTKNELLKKFFDGDKPLDILKELTYASVEFYSSHAKMMPHLMNTLQRIIEVVGEEARTIGQKDSSLNDTVLLNKFLKDDKGKQLLEELIEGSVKFHARKGRIFGLGDRVDRIIQVIGDTAMARYAKLKGR